MVVLEIAGLLLSLGVGMLFNLRGHSLKTDRELFVAPAALFFTFYPIIIALPEAHYKLINYSLTEGTTSFEEEDIFPYAFLISLLSVTVSAVVDKFMLEEPAVEEEEHRLSPKEEEWPRHRSSLQFLLTLSIGLQMVVNYYYICVEENSRQLLKEILLFLLLSTLINFSHGTLPATQATYCGRPASTGRPPSSWPSS
jgi:hypothetical protein